MAKEAKPHIYPKTNISKVYYRHLVDEIERDPLIRRSSLVVLGLFAAVSILTGVLFWLAYTNPGNLIQTSGTVTNISSGKTDVTGATTTFITFDFKSRVPAPVNNQTNLSVRQPALQGAEYHIDQDINIGYNPKNPYYARLLNDSRPPEISLALWSIPIILMLGLGFLVLFRHHARQVEIWNAAEAAEADD